jgi:hypothetical protein
MNKKTGYFIVSVSVLIIASFYISSTWGQLPIWDYVKASAYGTNVDLESETSVSFTVATPPAGSEITNKVYMEWTSADVNYTVNLEPGQNVVISHSRVDFPVQRIIEPASEPDHYNIIFEGAARYVQIDQIQIPEFPIYMVIPLFIATTLLAIIYRRKHKT